MRRSPPALARLLLALCLWVSPGYGLQNALTETLALWPEEAQRLRVGLKLFPACLGALESLEKRLAPDGSLHVLVVYQGADDTARQVVLSLAKVGNIRGLTLVVQAISATALDADRDMFVSAVFVASVGVPGKRLQAWSEQHQALVFSPFDGDVEAGAVAGIDVTDRILPYINVDQTRRAGLRFKSFFLDVARQHD